MVSFNKLIADVANEVVTATAILYEGMEVFSGGGGGGLHADAQFDNEL